MGTYVQYGCGLCCPHGWINFDVSPTLRLQRLPLIGFLFKHEPTIFPEEVRFGDIVAGLPLPDGIADGIYASHVLEHLCYDDFWIALRNTHRLLKPGGIFRLVVPDLEMRARKYLSQLDNGIADSKYLVHGHLESWQPSTRARRGCPSPFTFWKQRALMDVGRKIYSRSFGKVRFCQRAPLPFQRLQGRKF